MYVNMRLSYRWMSDRSRLPSYRTKRTRVSGANSLRGIAAAGEGKRLRCVTSAMTSSCNALGAVAVVSLSEQASNPDDTRRIGVTRFGGDIEDGATLESAMGGPNVQGIAHMAKVIAWPPPAPMRGPQLDVHGGACVLEATRHPEGKRVLHTSTTYVDTRFHAHRGPPVWEPERRGRTRCLRGDGTELPTLRA
jgi:hypothetical protein